MRYQNFLYVGLLDENTLKVSELKEVVPEVENDDYFHWGVEDILAVTYARLAIFQDKFPCRENAVALTKIEEAVLWLAQRKAERENRGVYGTEQK